MPAGAVRDSSNISAIPGLLQLRLPAMPLTQTAAVPKPPTMVATQPAAAAHAPEQQGLGEVLTPAGGGGIEGDICTRPEEDTATGPPIEVLTIDKYQGRDKPCIVLSFVRSNAKGSAGRLLADWQRLNVALTRAKHKLVMVGCAATLQEIPLLSSMLQMVERNGWRLSLSEALATSEVDDLEAR